ncbi:asparaginase [Streptomyces sp. NPDC098781]|uniref:asparaginase n=1 Tax=Streptomyces sp. NPDC098781 TaxID=3366097 RepID=UPI0037FEF3E9
MKLDNSLTTDRGTAGSSRPEVVLIAMGGTLSAVSARRTDFETYTAGAIPVVDLVKYLRPEIDQVADLTVEDFGTKSSGEYTIADHRDLAQRVRKHLRTADAVVVTSGTAVLEELAYFLDLTVGGGKPVVVTGSMRPWTVLGSDGPANLYNAVRLAASGRTGPFGTTVLLNDQILPARDATKTDTLRLHAFGTREFGVLGTVDEREIRLQRAPARALPEGRAPFDLSAPGCDELPRVEIVATYADAGGEAITASAEAGVRGIVIAGTPSPRQLAAASEAERSHGVLFVAAGGYGAGATRVDTDRLRLINAGDLSPKKARVLLLLACAESGDPDRIREVFATVGNAQF